MDSFFCRMASGVVLASALTFNAAIPETIESFHQEGPLPTKAAVLAQLQNVLKDEFSLWYPRTEDTVYGGYFTDLNYRWDLAGPQTKMIVTQARLVWSASHGKKYYADKSLLRKAAGHGFRFLRDVMWDKQDGGFYDLVTREGEVIKEHGEIVKRAYGNAFAIYGLAAYYKAWGDTAALHLAQAAFRWLDQHSWDPVDGGYFQFLSRDGKPFTEGYDHTPPKDQNSSIHLLEALTELYHVWPDPLVRERLSTMLHLIRDRMVTDKGYLQLFFKKDWTPISFRDASGAERERNYELDHVSFGHDIETGYLLLEASSALGLKNDTTTQRIAKKMVDHSLLYGWDKEHGGLFDGGYYFAGKTEPAIVKNTKEWWAQLEALNSCLMMAQKYPNDPMHYEHYFLKQWKYCDQYLLDHEYGGWYWGGIDIVPANTKAAKASIWKVNYHTSRAIINCIVRLTGRSAK
ncbi:MAG TPA: AGE family epimerase/isomerase [Bacteroidota bacterium]|nr:AGE family epimerase/isomerase [Bacteroidota bacterium]